MSKPRPPSQGDLVKVEWVDITEDPVGDPRVCKPNRRVSYGLFWEERKVDLGGWELPVLVTTTTVDPDGPEQSGYCVYPRDVVLTVTVVKRRKA